MHPEAAEQARGQSVRAAETAQAAGREGTARRNAAGQQIAEQSKTSAAVVNAGGGGPSLCNTQA